MGFILLYAFIIFLIHATSFAESLQDLSIQQIEIEEAASFNRRPSVDGAWNITPTVYICPNTPITHSRVRKAINVWKRLGHDMIGPLSGEHISECIGDSYRRGAILIKLRGQSFNESMLAMTSTYRYTETREIIGAVIQIQAFAPERERVIEHEFGHAFGWNHFNRRYHLMHEMHSRGGWDTYGLRRQNE